MPSHYTHPLTTPKFTTKKGRLTAYALMCGYVERREYAHPHEVWITLWQESPGNKCYHVRQHNFTTNERIFWDTFDTLKAARERYDQAIKDYKTGVNQHGKPSTD